LAGGTHKVLARLDFSPDVVDAWLLDASYYLGEAGVDYHLVIIVLLGAWGLSLRCGPHISTLSLNSLSHMPNRLLLPKPWTPSSLNRTLVLILEGFFNFRPKIRLVLISDLLDIVNLLEGKFDDSRDGVVPILVSQTQ
jgi:hypothetical protein